MDASVIVPTYNRPRQLGDCLSALVEQDYGRGRFEVIVADDGGFQDMNPVIDRFRDRLNIRLFTGRNAGPGAARNLGASKARGTFLAFTDDDCRPEKDWLSRLSERMKGFPNQIVGGRTINGLPDNPYSSSSQQIVDFVYQYYNGHGQKARFFSTNNMAVPLDTFHALGGFDHHFRTSEDRDFCDRASIHGFSLFYEPDALVYHYHHMTLPQFLYQHFAYGRGACRLYRAHRKRLNGSSTLEIRFYTATARRTLQSMRTLSVPEKCARAVLLFLWQWANLGGFIVETAKRSPKNRVPKYAQANSVPAVVGNHPRENWGT